ncbi:helix-turn-helix domain-containing protein [Confluentibacter sediminis]|uniref:helix-turn-helix domain-containing protein n=1 Tax=Confluentibacter sediminis TaxID=2219045 RepID=UPI000DAC8B6B|nr:helix-turn-helix transcriptional regulator [Confluentibacter sediminis]
MIDYKDSLYKVIGEKIKSRRQYLKISQLKLSEDLKQISKNIELSRSSISNMEVGRHQIPLHVLYAICQLLKLEIKDLLPSYEEIVQFATSEISNYSEYLNSNNLNKNAIKSIDEVIKNI